MKPSGKDTVKTLNREPGVSVGDDWSASQSPNTGNAWDRSEHPLLTRSSDADYLPVCSLPAARCM